VPNEHIAVYETGVDWAAPRMKGKRTMVRRLLLVLSLVAASSVISSAWAAAANPAVGKGAKQDPGRYSGGESQNGNPVWLYVSASKTQVQDLVIQDDTMVCPNGFQPGDAFVIDSMDIGSGGTFSTTQKVKGVIGADNAPAKFTYNLGGRFSTSSGGAPEASGTYSETASFTLNGNSESCSSGTQTWSVTRDTQPTQPAGVGAPGAYRVQVENGDASSFTVSSSRHEMKDLTLDDIGFGCFPGDGSAGGTAFLKSLALPATGSFSATWSGVFAGNTPVNYTIKFLGHFHGTDSSGTSRASGSYTLTGSFVNDQGTRLHCRSGKQWWISPPLS
jgi:hypothetical protein